MSWPPYSAGARMHTSDEPPTRKSISAPGDVNSADSHHLVTYSGSLQAFHTSSTGASRTRVTTSKVSVPCLYCCRSRLPTLSNQSSSSRLHELSSLDDAKPQVCCRRGLDHPGRLELDVLAAKMLEHTGATAEEHRHEVYRDLVDQSCSDELLPDLRPSQPPPYPRRPPSTARGRSRSHRSQKCTRLPRALPQARHG
jgi:hypothetical protein